jgi:hypothetical protein
MVRNACFSKRKRKRKKEKEKISLSLVQIGTDPASRGIAAPTRFSSLVVSCK